MGKKQGKIKLYLLLFFLVYFGLHLLQPASQDWPVRRKNTSNHCFVFIDTLQSCLLLFDKTVNHLWRQFDKHSEHLDFWRRLEGIGAEVHTFISSNCVSPKNSDFYPFYKKKSKVCSSSLFATTTITHWYSHEFAKCGWGLRELNELSWLILLLWTLIKQIFLARISLFRLNIEAQFCWF